MRHAVVVKRFLRATYGGRTWSRLLYALVSGPLCLLTFAATGALLLGFGQLVVVTFLLAGLLVVLAGAPLLAGTLLGARTLGAVHRGLAGWLLGVNVPAPARFRPGQAH
jgi:uncharacterized membrane protein